MALVEVYLNTEKGINGQAREIWPSSTLFKKSGHELRIHSA